MIIGETLASRNPSAIIAEAHVPVTADVQVCNCCQDLDYCRNTKKENDDYINITIYYYNFTDFNISCFEAHARPAPAHGVTD